jgi:hypothetical protein
MNKRLFAIMLAFMLILGTTGTVFAEKKTGSGDDTGESSNTDAAAPDPGVSSGQDTTKTSTIRWVLPHGSTFVIDGEGVNIVLDWESLDITSERDTGNGTVSFIGIGGSSGSTDSDSSCGNGNGRGNCSCSCDNDNNGNGNGNSNGGGPLDSSDCGDVWVTPGSISASAEQIAPNYAVVLNQDPDENGVTIRWHISIAPTTVSYEKWKIVGHRHVACVEDDTKGNNQNKDADDPCPRGWHQVIEHIWACTVTTKTYKESISQLVAGASLTLDSRAWINGELANAYPGAKLQHPDWGISQTPSCVWNGDLCSWNFTAKIPVVDPGWYDIRLSGQTSGTRVSPARSFDINAGEFGVYLMDNTAMTQ